ncbi:MAG: hypothetical protein V5783_10545 [Pontiella sp.]
MLYIMENLVYVWVNIYFMKTFYSALYAAPRDSTCGGGVQIFYMLVFLPFTFVFSCRTVVFFDSAFNLSYFYTAGLFLLILWPALLLVISLFIPEPIGSQRLFNFCSIVSFFAAPTLYVGLSGVIIYLSALASLS